MNSKFWIDATMVANEFIDQNMAAANGEYVKVYLYILRHQGEKITTELVADALNHTEADVKRAIAYWERLGVLFSDKGSEEKPLPKVKDTLAKGQNQASVNQEEAAGNRKETAGNQVIAITELPKIQAVPVKEEQAALDQKSEMLQDVIELPVADKKIPQARPAYTPEQVSRLALEDDFTQLLYIAQKYMNKVFTPRECELFAYLYDGLHMPLEVLEYLVEYCVQGGHSSIRYMETVAINWHEKGIRTVDAAKAYTASYTKDGFAVMKAFGLNDRKPGEAENQMIKRWFKEYGFTKDVVIEACNRTLASIHNPSFQYADKILSEWRKAGVRHMGDIRILDDRRKNTEVRSGGKQSVAPKTGRNQFHNFEQRDTNYDAMVLERLKERLGEQ